MESPKVDYFIGKESTVCTETVREVKKALEKHGLDMREWKPGREADMVFVFGGDGTLLQVLQAMGENPIPVLGINCGELGFLMEVNYSNFKKFLPSILNGRYALEKRNRLILSGKKPFYALNEFVVCPSKSATLVRYILRVNGEQIWRDSADGLVIATPTGSTAYALSAGGPVITHDSQVYEIVPNNSVNQARRAMIVPKDAVTEIEVMDCPGECNVIIDGKTRIKCKDHIKITTSDKPALFVRLFPSYTVLSSKMKKKVDVFGNHAIRGESPSSKFILKVIEFEGPLTQKEIIKATQLPARTIRRNLERLIKKGLIIKKPFLEDPRQSLYMIAD
ncbi:MAG: NAD(+)/NADH kinase [Candidatus Diapherotrites archaeon]|nr:NAD(+)/NADH kinase [Candidatus Diapherotrites archaeon]